MAVKPIKKLWLTLSVLAQPLPVYLCEGGHPDLQVDGEPSYGNFDPNAFAIYIDWDTSDGSIYDTLFHELDHVFYVAGGSRFTVLRPHDEGADNLEETLTRNVSPLRYATYKDAGWLKLPRIPKKRKRKSLDK